jgi:hypothetical protein
MSPDEIFQGPVTWTRQSRALSAQADSKGIALSELINSLLKKNIELIEAVK